jgi:alpha-tubulin suppressor-like RCC1 family protein
MIIFNGKIRMASDITFTLTRKTISQTATAGAFGSSISGRRNQIVGLFSVGTSRVLYGIGKTENGELGVYNSVTSNLTNIGANNSTGFSAYLSNSYLITGGENHYAMVYRDNDITIQDRILTWGDNRYYQLGRGYDTSGINQIEKSRSPAFADISLTLQGTNYVRMINSGGFHTHVVTQQGRVINWGSNEYGQLGRATRLGETLSGASAEDITNLLSISGETPFAVYSGKYHTNLITLSGNVWAYGNNQYGQLGVNPSTYNVSYGAHKINISNVLEIATGDYFNAALKEDGTVWGWGDNREGQISDNISSPSTFTTPQQISPIGTTIVNIATGSNHLAMLKNDGTVLFSGRNDEYQAQLPSSRNRSFGFLHAAANNTFFMDIASMLYGNGEGYPSSPLLGADVSTSQNTTLITTNSLLNVYRAYMYPSLLTITYNLTPAPILQGRNAIIVFDEDAVKTSSDYQKDQKALCLLTRIEELNNVSRADCVEMGSSTPTQRVNLRFRSFQEKMLYERALNITGNQSVLRNS